MTAYKALLFREFGCCAEVFFFCFVRTTFCKVSGFWTCFALSFRIAGSFAFRRSLLDPTTYAIRDLNLIRLHELVGVKSDLAEPSSSLMTRVGFFCCVVVFVYLFFFSLLHLSRLSTERKRRFFVFSSLDAVPKLGLDRDLSEPYRYCSGGVRV